MLSQQRVWTTLGLILSCAGANAQVRPVMPFPAVESGAPTVQTVLRENRIRMTDADNGTLIVANLDRFPLFSNMVAGVTGSVEMQNQPGGCDLRYTFTNTNAAPARLGALMVGNLNLGNNITFQNFSHVGEPVVVDYNNYGFQGFQYPSSIYSPVWVVRNSQYAVGISLQYPIMEYKHDARVMLGSGAIDTPRGWFIQLLLSNVGDETEWGRLKNPAMLNPGESRTYIVSVRVTKNPSDWIRTLTPYRDFFRATYGGITYERDAREICPQIMGSVESIGPNNPYGLDWQDRRPDLHGFKPWADAIKAQHSFSRVVLWAPTGVYNEPQSLQYNYPYQFTTQWLAYDSPHDATDSQNGLASVHGAGIDLGLWWGRCLQVARRWNPTGLENFDPDNPEHVAAAFAEMDLAVQAGATLIGLDTFLTDMTPMWKAYPWLQALRQRYPNVKFCTEPRNCDILHTLGATFILAWPGSPQDSGTMSVPFYLADFLLPGHETWAMMGYQGRRMHGMPVTQEVIQADADRIASLGYVPLMFQEYAPQGGAHTAAESWIASVPADLLHGSGWNVNFNHGSAVRGADGRLHIIRGDAPVRPAGGRGPSGQSAPSTPSGVEPSGSGVSASGNQPGLASIDSSRQSAKAGGSRKGHSASRGSSGGSAGGISAPGSMDAGLDAAGSAATSGQLVSGLTPAASRSADSPDQSGPSNNPLVDAGFIGAPTLRIGPALVPLRGGSAPTFMGFDRMAVRRALEAAQGRVRSDAIRVLTTVPDQPRE